ncbi:MAG: PAS domain-containing protein, partial [Lachnospiraceae bacterium]|nr:PAS domain-containing protein [Lachnospiraceae bacterium]
MKNKIEAMESVLQHHISGFHQYVLDTPIHLSFVSQSFCELLALTEEELLSGEEDRYFSRIYVSDRKAYAEFLHRLSGKEQSLTLQYRIIAGDGRIHVVNDTMVSERTEQGTLVGSSILTDVTVLKAEEPFLYHMNTASYGILRYTCEKHPKVTYINDYMLDILRFPKMKNGETDTLELYKENIYLMIPMEERMRFSRFLDRVYQSDKPMVGGMTVLRCDGVKTRLFGWISRCVNSQGMEEFQCVCIDSSERYYEKRSKEINRYLTVLSGVYRTLSVYDFSNETVQYFYGDASDLSGQLENIPMQMETATEKWIRDSVIKEDQERVRDYFDRYFQERRIGEEPESAQINYRIYDPDGMMKVYTGIFLKIDAFVDLFCSRCISDESEVSMLRNENDSLKNLVMNFSDGIAAFEIKGGYVTPLYVSDNLCSFFGYTKEEWLFLMKQKTWIEDFVSRSGIAYEEFQKIFRDGEAEFSYYDLKQKKERRIRAVCSDKKSNLFSKYIMLYNIVEEVKEQPQTLSGKKVYIRTFGYFDVFVDGAPIAFRSQKAKELFALLVDRRGGFVSSEEAIGFLWEDEPLSSVVFARYRKIALRLKNIL